MSKATFSRWVFRIAGIYGIVVLVPHFFLEGQISSEYPPPITHPEFFYGFVCVALAWQIAFLLISLDPPRYRMMMLGAVCEKLFYATAALVLFLNDRTGSMVVGFGLLDGFLGILFLAAWWHTPCDPAWER